MINQFLLFVLILSHSSEGRGPVFRPGASPRLVTGKSPAGYWSTVIGIFMYDIFGTPYCCYLFCSPPTHHLHLTIVNTTEWYHFISLYKPTIAHTHRHLLVHCTLLIINTTCRSSYRIISPISSYHIVVSLYLQLKPHSAITALSLAV